MRRDYLAAPRPQMQVVVMASCLSWINLISAATAAEFKPISGVYRAEMLEESPSLTASGICWWSVGLLRASASKA